jgi:hypothetical protein
VKSSNRTSSQFPPSGVVNSPTYLPAGPFAAVHCPLRARRSRIRVCKLVTELVSVAIDEISRVMSYRKPFTKHGLPNWVGLLQC